MESADIRGLSKKEILPYIDQYEEKIRSLNDEVAYLRNENARLSEAWKARSINIDKAGSIAEASLAITGIFASAQSSADIYLENIRKLEERLTAETDGKIAEAQRKCEQMLRETETRCAEREAQEKVRLEELRRETKERFAQINKLYKEFGEILE